MRRFTKLIITGLLVLVIASMAHAADIDWDANLDKPKTVDIHGGRDFSKWADGYAKGAAAVMRGQIEHAAYEMEHLRTVDLDCYAGEYAIALFMGLMLNDEVREELDATATRREFNEVLAIVRMNVSRATIMKCGGTKP